MLECRDVTVRFGLKTALNEVSLCVPEGTVTAVMGESGSGKSTLLRVVAGLQPPSSGSVAWRGESMDAVAPYRRGFGFMFQDYALFPHLSVADNVQFGLRTRRIEERESSERTRRMLDLVGLAGYGSRQVAQLSGGERQRVALARTLAPRPDLILLDEPLGALDRARRDQLLGDMQRIFSELGVTALYVTHDHIEAFTVGDSVAVLDEGVKVAEAAPSELWTRPAHPAAASLLGFPVVTLEVDASGSAVVGGAPVGTGLPAGRHRVALRPGAFRIADTGVPVHVLASRFVDGRYQATVTVDDVEATAEATRQVAPGPAYAALDPRQLSLLDG